MSEVRTINNMDVKTIYALRDVPRKELSPETIETIRTLKITFNPTFRKPPTQNRVVNAPANWRANLIQNIAKTIMNKDDDDDYRQIYSRINKMSKSTYTKLIGEVMEIIERRDEQFRFRVTTMLFDLGVRQGNFATLVADAYALMIKTYPDAKDDLNTQIKMFDTIYDVKNSVDIVIPVSTDPTFEKAILEWSLQMEKKRAFAFYINELFVRNLIEMETYQGFVNTALADLEISVKQPFTEVMENHIHSIAKFLLIAAPKVECREAIKVLLALPRDQTPSLKMKSRFALEDAAKAAFK